jgi:hypothetical protein
MDNQNRADAYWTAVVEAEKKMPAAEREAAILLLAHFSRLHASKPRKESQHNHASDGCCLRLLPRKTSLSINSSPSDAACMEAAKPKSHCHGTILTA